jgi:hypothetical protein
MRDPDTQLSILTAAGSNLVLFPAGDTLIRRLQSLAD